LQAGNANFPIPFKHRAVDFLEGFYSRVSRGGNYIIVVNTHMPKRVRAPALMFKKDQRSSIHQSSETAGPGSSPGNAVVRQTHGNNLANPIRKRSLVTYDRSERKPTDEKDEHKLKRGHLLAWTPPDNTDDHDEEEISKERAKNCRHRNNL
jgi:hypothetical protein